MVADARQLVRELTQLLLAPAFAAFDPVRLEMADDLLVRIRAVAGDRDHVLFAIARVGVWLDQQAATGATRMPLETALAFLALAVDPAPMSLQVPANVDVGSTIEQRTGELSQRGRELQLINAARGRVCLCELDLLAVERGLRQALAAWQQRVFPGDVAAWYTHADELSALLTGLIDLDATDQCQSIPVRASAIAALQAAANRCDVGPDSRQIAAAALRELSDRIASAACVGADPRADDTAS